ncbi:MAG: hypothetical protein U1D00_16245, partial [Mycobacterium sp.]|nr:hypothetical protein [Mycobacterium sp.]
PAGNRLNAWARPETRPGACAFLSQRWTWLTYPVMFSVGGLAAIGCLLVVLAGAKRLPAIG